MTCIMRKGQPSIDSTPVLEGYTFKIDKRFAESRNRLAKRAMRRIISPALNRYVNRAWKLIVNKNIGMAQSLGNTPNTYNIVLMMRIV